MLRWNPSTDERGSAPLEFIFGGVLLLVPLLYVIVALGAIQGQALGAEAGARHVARVVAQAPDAATAHAHADQVISTITREYDLDPDAVAVSISCEPAGATCPHSGATLLVTVTSQTRLPLIPAVLDRIASVPLSATAVQKVSRFWGAE